jgi:hypothetical protein
MKKSLTLILFFFSSTAFSQIIHLDCTATITKILMGSFGKSSNSVGDTKGPYLFDIDLDKETGKIGNWSTETYSTNPNNPDNIMNIGDHQIRFGDVVDGDWYMAIRRKDLFFAGMIGYGAKEFMQGECVLVEKRELPKRAF